MFLEGGGVFFLWETRLRENFKLSKSLKSHAVIKQLMELSFMLAAWEYARQGKMAVSRVISVLGYH